MPGQASFGSGTMFAVGKPRSRPRWSPGTTSPRSRKRRPSSARRRVDLARRSAARGCGSRRRSRRRPRPAARRASRSGRPAASSAAVPRARWPKRKFSPDRDVRGAERSTSTRSMNSAGLLLGEASSNGTTTSSSTPSSAISSALSSSVVSSFGPPPGSDDRRRVRLEGEHRVVARDHLAVAEVDAVELAHGDAPRARLDFAQGDDVHRVRKASGCR